ncbi:MAG: helix-turn-helix transcriptional regulator [Actinomycetota bacterium]
MVENATIRLSRLLAMVPWLLRHQGITLDAAAAEFSISTKQLIKDLELLFVCGLPGHLPDDLIEAEWDSGHIFLSNADTISRPLRLGIDEALTLIVGLRALSQVPGLDDREAVSRALAKLEDAAGEAASAATSVGVDLGRVTDPHVLRCCQQALQERRRVHLKYLVPERDASTERDVDPMRILAVDGHWYLEGWCHRAESVRLFRLDRVLNVVMLDDSGVPPPQAQERDLSNGIFLPDPNDYVVELLVRPAAKWIVDYYPTEEVSTRSDGTAVVVIRTGDLGWLRALLLRLGSAAQVLKPAEFAADVVAAANSALDAYERAPSPHR